MGNGDFFPCRAFTRVVSSLVDSLSHSVTKLVTSSGGLPAETIQPEVSTSLCHIIVFFFVSYMAFFYSLTFFLLIPLLTVFSPPSLPWLKVHTTVHQDLCLIYICISGIPDGSWTRNTLVSGGNKWSSLFSWHQPHFHPLKANALTPCFWLSLPRCFPLKLRWALPWAPCRRAAYHPTVSYVVPSLSYSSFLSAVRSLFDFQLPAFLLASFSVSFLCPFGAERTWVGPPSVSLATPHHL